MATVWRKTRLTVFNCNPSDISKCMNYRVFLKHVVLLPNRKVKKTQLNIKKIILVNRCAIIHIVSAGSVERRGVVDCFKSSVSYDKSN